MMENKQNAWVILALVALLAGGPIACDKTKGIGEKTGKALDEAAEDLKKAGEEIKDGAEEVGKAIEDGAEEVKEAVEEAAD